MLEELTIQNYALIDHVSVSFTSGLNILSGETGAGKSILIGALGLILGMKGDVQSIRTGEDECSVSAVIRVDGNPDAMEWLTGRDIRTEDGSVIVRRTLKRSGRGSVFIQNIPVTREDLAEFTSLIFDLHGQHEHQSLLSVENHRRLVDRYGDHEELLAALSREFLSLSALKKDYEQLINDERDALREKELYEYAVNEIEKAGIHVGEDEELEKERGILAHAEKLFLLLEEFSNLVAEGKNGSLARLRQAMGVLDSIARIDSDLSEHTRRLENAFYEIEDIADTLNQYRASVHFSQERLDECEQRLQLIHRLEKKYGSDIAGVLAYGEKAKKSLERFDNREREKEEMVRKIGEAEKRVSELAKDLSQKRKNASALLQDRIQERLKPLGMPKAQFSIDLSYNESQSGKPLCGPSGFDRVEFMISPNPGEPLKPLNQIASGGELSRVMLAIKSVLAEKDHIQTLIFDEIDTGIGGEVAVAVGEHLKAIGTHKQVLCITHLASIASCAENHIKIEKVVDADRTFTRVTPVTGQDRIKEIARMLSGDSTEGVSLAHAEELLKKFSK
ncbi:MAG TPA: DNA repair protein RecN [Spirochaetia bacterium]|nr:DNA repair protein RecN [Spirochaetia bacterium]